MLNKLSYLGLRLLTRTVGKMSQGIQLALRHGLTAGKTLDYIYRNQPQGISWIGRWIDAKFLSHPGWEAVRERRRSLELLMEKSAKELLRQDRAIALLDIASGPASYILQLLRKLKGYPIYAECRDMDLRWVREGEQQAKRLNLTNIKFAKGDAFDRSSFDSLSQKPNLIISSGFYDWINAEEQIKSSIHIVHQLLDTAGHFILTFQMAHPDLEMTQYLFKDFHHRPLRMTMRPESQFRKWLDECGFDVTSALQDRHGYYAVLQAVKRG